MQQNFFICLIRSSCCFFRYLCINTSTASHPIPFPISLSVKAPHPRFGTMILYHHVLTLHAFANRHSIRYLERFLWSKLTMMKKLPNLSVFRNNMRKSNLSDYLTDNSNCCNLCSVQPITQIWIYIILYISLHMFHLSCHFVCY